MTVKRLKEAYLADNVNKDISDEIACLREENALLHGTLEVLTHELEKSRAKVSENIECYAIEEKLDKSCIEVVTIDANSKLAESPSSATKAINKPKHQQDPFNMISPNDGANERQQVRLNQPNNPQQVLINKFSPKDGANENMSATNKGNVHIGRRFNIAYSV